MNLTMLVTLRTILEQGSFTAAAGVVGCSPSAVSLQVKQLEQYFGKPLFDRSTRVVAPTAFAHEVVSAVGDFSHRLQMLRSRPAVEVAGRIRVGVITSMQSDVLPQALHELRRKHPSLDVVVPPLNDSDEMISELKAARLDVALLVRPEAGGSRRLVWRELHRQPYVLLAPPNASGKTVRQLLEAYDWIGYDLSLSGGRVAARHLSRHRRERSSILPARRAGAPAPRRSPSSAPRARSAPRPRPPGTAVRSRRPRPSSRHLSPTRQGRGRGRQGNSNHSCGTRSRRRPPLP